MAVRLSLIVFLCALALQPAAATPIGTISFGITPGGGATLSASALDWYLPAAGGFGDFTTGGGSVSYSGGVITALTNPYGRIGDLSFPSSPFSNFLLFYIGGTHNPAVPGSGVVQGLPAWDVVGIGPPSGTDCATDPGVNIVCSINVTIAPGPYVSPLILVENSFGGTDVRLDLILLGSDATGSINWNAIASTTIPNMSPAQIAAAINAGQSINIQSWSLSMASVPVSEIPEPATMSLVGAALLIGLIGRRSLARRRAARASFHS